MEGQAFEKAERRGPPAKAWLVGTQPNLRFANPWRFFWSGSGRGPLGAQLRGTADQPAQPDPAYGLEALIADFACAQFREATRL